MATRTMATMQAAHARHQLAHWLRLYWKPALISLGFWAIYSYACVTWIGH